MNGGGGAHAADENAVTSPFGVACQISRASAPRIATGLSGLATGRDAPLALALHLLARFLAAAFLPPALDREDESLRRRSRAHGLARRGRRCSGRPRPTIVGSRGSPRPARARRTPCRWLPLLASISRVARLDRPRALLPLATIIDPRGPGSVNRAPRDCFPSELSQGNDLEGLSPGRRLKPHHRPVSRRGPRIRLVRSAPGFAIHCFYDLSWRRKHPDRRPFPSSSIWRQ